MYITINRTVLMSGADFFDNSNPINPYMNTAETVDVGLACREHASIKKALEQAGVTVVQVPAAPGCPDGVYTANWALCRDNKAVMARLPDARKQEEPFAQETLRKLGKKIIKVPGNLRFSGQGDALPCGDYLFANHDYRTDRAVHGFLAEQLGYQVISLQTVPLLDSAGQPATNAASGWPDSYFYDIDLALAVLRPPADGQPGLIAWCPQAFVSESRAKVRALDNIDAIEVSMDEAKAAFACNLVSTGETVVMGDYAPRLQAAIAARGLQVITPHITELAKGGGYIRCTTLTLDNA